MKRLFTGLILIPAFFSALSRVHAQPFGQASENFRVVKQNYENSTGELGKTEFFYDSRGRMVRSLWSLDNGSRYSENHYQYDAAGNLVSAYRNFSDGIKSSEFFVFDSLGNKTEEYFHRSDGVKGSANWFYEDGKLVKAVMDKYKGWLSGTLEVRYNILGRKSTGMLYQNGQKAAVILWNYDEKGNLLKESWDFEGKWSQEFTYVYEEEDKSGVLYSSPLIHCPAPFRIKNENYSWNGSYSGPSDYEYNSAGQLVRKVFTRSDGLITSTDYFYDLKGRLSRSERKYSDGRKDDFFYTWDEQNHLLNRSSYRKDSLFSLESWFYDKDGNLAQAYYNNVDQWLTGYLVFKSGFDGIIKEADFQAEKGPDAGLIFQYDSNGCLIKLRWNFNDGTFQEYSFEYE